MLYYGPLTTRLSKKVNMRKRSLFVGSCEGLSHFKCTSHRSVFCQGGEKSNCSFDPVVIFIPT